MTYHPVYLKMPLVVWQNPWHTWLTCLCAQGKYRMNGSKQRFCQFKSGSTTELDNYRLISILPVLSTVLERVVHMQFIDYFESNRLLYKYQFGFRRQHSTNLAVMFFSDSVCRRSVFIDVRKAFDKVDYSCLLENLKTIAVHSQEHVWFTYYLFNRHQTIVYDKL